MNELYNNFKDNAAKVQAEVSRAANMDEIFSYTIDLTKKQGGRNIVAPDLAQEQMACFENMCMENGLELLKESARDQAETIDTALTRADFAIAETGTMVLDSNSEGFRLATMVSKTHVIWVDENLIVPILDDILDYLDEGLKKGPGYFAFITGASRTADIERVLAIGVHGPETLHIVVR